MKERLSKQARRMCRQCFYKSTLDDKCKDGASILQQNDRAKSNKCQRAAIQGGTFGNPPHMLDTVLGDMIRLRGGSWIFEGKNYQRTDESGKPLSRKHAGGLVGKKIDVY